MRGRMTRGAARGLAFAGAAALVASPVQIGAQPQPVGVNAAVHNVVQIRRGAAQPRRAVLKERVLLNDRVLTGAGSRLQIALLDRSIFTVGANANVAIDRFVYDPARNTRSGTVSVTKGAFRFMSGRAATRPKGAVRVNTPVASIGVRGTIFDGVVGEDAVRIAAGEAAVGTQAQNAQAGNATLVVLRGPGPATQGDTSPGEIDVEVGGRIYVLNRPGMALFVPGGGAAPVQFNLSRAGLQALQALLGTTPAMAAASSSAAATQGAGPADAPGELAGPREAPASTAGESVPRGSEAGSAPGSSAETSQGGAPRPAPPPRGIPSGGGQPVGPAGIALGAVAAAALVVVLVRQGDGEEPLPKTP